MGRYVVSHSFFRALQDSSAGNPAIIDRKIPNSELRNNNHSWHSLFVGDPNLEPFAYERSWASPTSFSIIGITHTLSTPGALNILSKLVNAPLFEWDALICTSQSAKTAVETIFDNSEQILVSRGGFPPQRPYFPVIPLGIDPDSFKRVCTKSEARRRLGIPQNAIVVLWTGRLELHCKAHHGATFKALAKAQETCPEKPWFLLMYGTAVMKGIPTIIQELANSLCPEVQVRILNGHNLELGSVARSASTMFLSLVDCLQETFGLTPVEAMAAGLPVVVSDWNGYKDTVAHGHTGYRVTTQSYAPGWSDAALLMQATQDSSLDRLSTRISSQIHVDASQAGRTLAHLASNPELARKMGEAGQRHVQENFIWPIILKQYQQLVEEVRVRRESAQRNMVAIKVLPPLQSIFRQWPSQSLDTTSKLRVSESMTTQDLERSLQTAAFQVYSRELASAESIRKAYKSVLVTGSTNSDEIQKMHSLSDIPQAIGWLIKHGFLVAEI